MNNKYRRITFEDRCHIHAWLQEEISYSEIAKRLGFSRSAISRELKRNSLRYKYNPRSAQSMSKSRYRCCRKPYKMTGELKELVIKKIKANWTPKQISGRLALERKIYISHECIYAYLRKNKAYYRQFMRRFCRRGGGRYVHKRAAKQNRLSIAERPKIVGRRSRIGDWERDSFFAFNKKPLLVCGERKSKLIKISKSKSLKSKHIGELSKELIESAGRKAYTITNDRGTEFAVPVEGVRTYYCDPMSPQQRGFIENSIGLLRQYIKNTTRLDELTESDIKEIEDKINMRPRESLNYKSPYEVFYNVNVALAY